MSRTNISEVKIGKKSKIIPKIQSDANVSDKICRICMESETTNPVISPCRCIGSVKFVHENCLKSWLLSHKKTTKRIHCEICKTQFQMEFKYSQKCIFWNKNKPKAHFFYLPLFITFLFSLFGIIYLIATNSIALKGENKLEYKIVILILCSVFCLIFLVLTLSLIKETCIVVKLDQWIIKSRSYENEEINSKDNFDETCVRDLKAEQDISRQAFVVRETKDLQSPHQVINNTFLAQRGRNFSDELVNGSKIKNHKPSSSQPSYPNEDLN